MIYSRAVGLAIFAGVLSCCLNLAFAFSQDIISAAVVRGATPVSAPFSVWALTLLGGPAVNLGYCLRLVGANRSWSGFRRFTDAPLAVLMGVLWMGAVSLYGAGATLLGADGPTAGWVLFQISMVLAAGASGFLSGEWRGAPAGAARGMIAGLVLLSLAMVLIAPR
jgi:L-rhamnose-H+ transport protein